MNNHYYNKNLRLKARELRKNPTKAEKQMWANYLCRRQFEGFRFLRQRPMDQYIVDFFCPELMLIIEIDGRIHDSDEQIQSDRIRDGRLRELGYAVLRFSNFEVFKHPDIIYAEMMKIAQMRE